MNSLLLNTNGDRRLFVDPKCKEVIKSLSRHTYKEGTQVPNKNDGFDHLCDAVGYGVEFLFPVTRQVERKNPKSFGVF